MKKSIKKAFKIGFLEGLKISFHSHEVDAAISKISVSSKQVSMESMRDDWARIGRDFYSAMSKINVETNFSSK